MGDEVVSTAGTIYILTLNAAHRLEESNGILQLEPAALDRASIFPYLKNVISIQDSPLSVCFSPGMAAPADTFN